MIVNRRTFIAARAKLNKAVDLLRQARDQGNCPGAVRIYTAVFGPFDKVVLEMEFQDLDQYQKFWAETGSGEAEWWEQWFASTESGGTNEIWRLAE